MQKIKIYLLFFCLITFFLGTANSQTTQKKLSKKERKLKSLEVNKNGFPWVGATTVEYDKPTDLGSSIVYGFRGIFGKNKKFIVDYNCQANVTGLTLSRNEVTASCLVSQNYCLGSMGIGVYTEAVDLENDVLTYNYIISGGKIIGQGSKVTWDLSGEKPGIYTITAGVDDGCGICGKTITKETKIINCSDCK